MPLSLDPSKTTAELTQSEALIVGMLTRLFWLVTQAPGVARYATDVRFFVEAEKLISTPKKAAELEKLAAGYEREKD